MAAPILDLAVSTGWVVDQRIPSAPQAHDIATVSTALDSILGAELAGAQDALGVTAEAILVAALGRTVGRTIGDGMLAVDVVGGYSAPRQVPVQCVSHHYFAAADLLEQTRRVLSADARPAATPAEVLFSYGHGGSAPDRGHVLALHAYRDSDFAEVVHLEWRYDTRSFDRNTVEELSEQFPLAMIELTSG
jgi:hypothetical protein